MKNVYIDWGITKPHTVLVDNEESVVVFKSGMGIDSEAFNAYLEAGCPHKFLYQLINSGCEVYLCDGKLVKALRGEKEKTDENDVHFIRELWLKQPNAFHKLSVPEREDLQVNFLMSRYLHFMKDCARFKNRQKAYEREFGESETYKEILVILERKKKEALKKVKPLLKEELKKVEDIKGVGLRLLAGLLATAHPKHFSTLSKYLGYCGYKASSWKNGTGKYSRTAKTLAWQMTKSLIMHKDPNFYQLYLKIKADLKKKYPNFSKGKIDGMAKNRVSTFILKELYSRFSTENKPEEV